MPNYLQALAKLELGYLALEDGSPTKAGRLWRECIRLLKSLWESFWLPLPIDALVYLAARERRVERAVLFSGTRWSRGAQYMPSPTERLERQAELEEVRRALGDDRFEQLYQEGGRLTFEQALELALDEIHE